MVVQTVQEALRQEIEHLPEDLAREALDFILFAKVRREEEAYLWDQVEEAQAYRQNHPDSVATVTAGEWDKNTAQMDDEED